MSTKFITGFKVTASRLPVSGTIAVIAAFGIAGTFLAPSSAHAQMFCPVAFNVTSNETIGALQIKADYAAAAALGDITDCTVQQSGVSDVNTVPASNYATVGYADTTGFTGPDTFATCTFKTVGATAPVAGNFAITIQDASNTNVPPGAINPTVVAVVGACVPSGSCEQTPAVGCRVPTVVAKAKMSLKNNADNTKDQGKFQWKSGAVTVVADFRDPTTAGETWSWCIYAGGTLVRGSDIPAGAGWAAAGTSGFQFKGDVQGIAQVKLKAGEAGKAQVSVKAKSKAGNFVSPTLPLADSVVMQLIVDDGVTPLCFQSTADPATDTNDASQFKAVGNP